MLDIEKIAQEKIRSMEESSKLKEYIEKKTEEFVQGGIDSALNGWKIRNEVEDAVAAAVSGVLKTIDFTTYNGFIADKVRQVADEVLKEDAANKVRQAFEGIFVKKYDGINLSEIIEKYRGWLIDSLDESEQYEHDNCFYLAMEEGTYHNIKVKLSLDESRFHDINTEYGIYFSIGRSYGDNKIGHINMLTIDGGRIDQELTLRHFNNFEAMMINLYYNRTLITIDIEDTEYVDTSLGLDI